MKHKIITILLGLIILIVGLTLVSINISAETPANCGSGTDVSPKECWTCIDITASPSTIWRGESSTLTLYLDNRPDGTAVCNINNGVLPNTTLNDGTYNYIVWPGNGPTIITYTATCSGIGGPVSKSVTVTVNNRPSNVPTLITPPNNVWITYEPTFQASASDPEGDTVKICFDLDSNSSCDYWTGLAASGSTFSWSPSISDTSGRLWRAKTQDSYGAESDWSGSWTLKKDTVKPSASIDQENGVSLDADIWVNLTESDATSGIAEGDVDIRINSGAWQNYASTIDSFTYTGVKGNTYEFRYRVKDNAGWWCDFVYDGSVYINHSPEILSTWVTYYYCEADSRTVTLNWEYYDEESDPQASYRVQIDTDASFSPPFVLDTGEVSSSSGSYTPPDPTIFNWNATYQWRVRVKDQPGSWSSWEKDNFKIPKHQYPACDFSWTPEYPNAYDEDYPDAPDTAVQFTDESKCYDDSGNVVPCASWSWTFQNGDPANSSEVNPTVKFLAEGDKTVTLEVCDSESPSYCCTEEKSIYVNFPLPEWKERIPR